MKPDDTLRYDDQNVCTVVCKCCLNQAVITALNHATQLATTLSGFLVSLADEYQKPAKKMPSVGGGAAGRQSSVAKQKRTRAGGD